MLNFVWLTNYIVARATYEVVSGVQPFNLGRPETKGENAPHAFQTPGNPGYQSGLHAGSGMEPGKQAKYHTHLCVSHFVPFEFQ